MEPLAGRARAALTADPAAASRRGWLWAEFVALYVGAPLAIALFLNPRWMFAALFGFTLVGIGLIWRTGEFDWRELVRGWGRVRWDRTAAFALLVGAAGVGIMAATRPGFMPDVSPERLRFLAMLWLAYPLLSALPQELIFRALFFHRYAPLLPDPRTALLVNAAVFALAHLMYWSVVVTAMTFVGGWIFGRTYRRRGFPAVWMLHAVAGNVLFTVGMGTYFWSGNVVRPF